MFHSGENIGLGTESFTIQLKKGGGTGNILLKVFRIR